MYDIGRDVETFFLFSYFRQGDVITSNRAWNKPESFVRREAHALAAVASLFEPKLHAHLLPRVVDAVLGAARSHPGFTRWRGGWGSHRLPGARLKTARVICQSRVTTGST